MSYCKESELFEFVKDPLWRDALSKTYKAVTLANAWDFMRDFSPDSQTGFLMTNHPKLTSINNECEKLCIGHSGTSWALCMRNMEFIAKHGWEAYKTSNLKQ